MNNDDLEIDLIPSPHDPATGAHVGVRIRHKIMDLILESTSETTQHANKLNVIKKLKEIFPEIEEEKVRSKTN